uniref:TPR_REGION domain-containing protein n=1 Tax=Steinernema glaseri TaxID=37863 RepID=A0A1I7Z9U6_9BILA
MSVTMDSRWRAAIKKEFETGKIKHAIVRIQQMIRMNANGPEDPKTNAILLTYLGEAYRRNVNPSSAIRCFERAFELASEEDRNNILLQKANVHLMLGQYEEVINICAKIPSSPPVDLLHGTALVQQAKTLQASKEQLDLLRRFFVIAPRIIGGQAKISQGYKVFADACMLAVEYNTVRAEGNEWGITSKLDMLDVAGQMLCELLRRKKNCHEAWDDLGKVLTKKFKLGSTGVYETAKAAFVNAIKLSCVRAKRVDYWCHLGYLNMVADKHNLAQHCFLTALKLNEHSGVAWAMLSVLYFQCGMYELALDAIDHAHLAEPGLMESWSMRAILFEMQGLTKEAMHQFRHVVVSKPSALSMMKYAYYTTNAVMGKMEMHDSDSIEMKSLFNLYYTAERTPSFLLYLAIFAEHMGYLEEAYGLMKEAEFIDSECLNTVGPHLSRVAMRLNKKVDVPKDKSIGENAAFSIDQVQKSDIKTLFDGVRLVSPYSALIQAIESDNDRVFREFYTSYTAPLLISSSLLLKIPLRRNILRAIQDVRPLHQLCFVYPPDLVHDAELNHLTGEDKPEHDAGFEPVLVRRDRQSEPLCQSLAKMRAEFRAKYEETVVVVEEEEVVDDDVIPAMVEEEAQEDEEGSQEA